VTVAAPPRAAGLTVRHVTALVSDDGAYGGPVSVATGQVGELRARGHDGALLSLWRGRGAVPAAVDGVPLLAVRARTLVPGMGFLGLLNPRLLRLLWRETGRADVLHLHAGRDLVSLAALAVARLRRTPFLAQTHGMVQPRSGPVARLFDRVYVPLLRGSRACLVLTEEEERGLAEVFRGRHPPLLRLPNGVRAQARTAVPDRTLVLYLARLQARKRPDAFVAAAALLVARLPQLRFVLHGADEGALPSVERAIREQRLEPWVRYGGPLAHDAALDRLAAASVYVLPSVDEPFPMSVLEALAVGTPVVTTSSCGIAAELAAAGAALVTDGTPAGLADAVEQLLTDADLRARTVAAGYAAVAGAFSLAAVADRLADHYARALRC
jgi:glycosyltransferase involved in cell wall biosynthesis